MAREVTNDGDRITALASAGTLYLASYQKLTLTRSACGSIRSTLPTATPRTRTSSPTNMPLVLAKYAVRVVRLVRSTDRVSITTPASRTTASTAAKPLFVLRQFIADPLARLRQAHLVPGRKPGSVAVPAGSPPAAPAAVRQAAMPVARGRGSSPCRAGRTGDRPGYR